MQCRACKEPAIGACSRCGLFFCADHGGEVPGSRAMCTACFERARPVAAFGIIFLLVSTVPGGIGVAALGQGNAMGSY